MERFGGTVVPLRGVDIAGVAAWIAAIPLSAWPQGERMVADYPYPAMVSNQSWHDFAGRTEPLVTDLMERFPGCRPDHRMLSVVVPGQKIVRHDDVQSESWRVRVHVPLISNPDAIMFFDEEAAHLSVGQAYLVNTEVPHWLHNLGDEPRIHFFFDVREG